MNETKWKASALPSSTEKQTQLEKNKNEMFSFARGKWKRLGHSNSQHVTFVDGRTKAIYLKQMCNSLRLDVTFYFVDNLYIWYFRGWEDLKVLIDLSA